MSRFTNPSSEAAQGEEKPSSDEPAVSREVNKLQMPLDIKTMLANTRREIEERKKETESIRLQHQSGSAPLTSGTVPPTFAPLLPLPPGMLPPTLPQQQQQQQQNGLQQALLMQRNRAAAIAASTQAPADRFGQSVHPLAYARELQVMRGMTVGPSDLEKVIKAAEVGLSYCLFLVFSII